MKAVGLTHYLPVSDQRCLEDFVLPAPEASGQDLLVAVKAISVNPVDTKVRAPKDAVESSPRVLGWDAAGTVVAVGEGVRGFKPGDDVYYAGDITRQGSNSEFQLVDERIVSIMPTSLDFAQAAALPLTSITAWEALSERLGISMRGDDEGKSILIVGGAGGVGSMAIQLAKQCAKLTVIATASRSETVAWCESLGADLVVNHRNNLAVEIRGRGLENVDYILCLNGTDGHWNAMVEAVAPQGLICCIVDNAAPLAMDILKKKSAGLVWEFMFTRSMFQTEDMAHQGEILKQLSKLVDSGEVRTSCKEIVSPISAENLRAVHAKIESGATVGKIVLSGWD